MSHLGKSYELLVDFLRDNTIARPIVDDVNVKYPVSAEGNIY